MFTIYDLKHQLHKLIVQETQKTFISSKMNFINNLTIYTSNDNTNNLNVDSNIVLTIKSINLESIDTKTYYYKINFSLFLYFNYEFFYNYEQIIFNLLEKILKLLHSMEFYYCHKVNNINIVSKVISNKSKDLETPFIIIDWVTNLNFNGDWFN